MLLTGVILGELGAFEPVILGALDVLVFGRAHIHWFAEERNFVQVLTRDLRHPRLRHLFMQGKKIRNTFEGEKGDREEEGEKEVGVKEKNMMRR